MPLLERAIAAAESAERAASKKQVDARRDLESMRLVAERRAREAAAAMADRVAAAEERAAAAMADRGMALRVATLESKLAAVRRAITQGSMHKIIMH